jgi:surface antigen
VPHVTRRLAAPLMATVVLALGMALLAVAQVTPCGEDLIPVETAYRGIPPKSNQGKGSNTCLLNAEGTDRTLYGLGYQCVEYVRRFYAEALGVAEARAESVTHDTSLWRLGNAVDFATQSNVGRLGLVVFRNGESVVAPAPDDILVFRGVNTTDDFGHVAIVTHATSDTVSISEQNFSLSGVATLAMVRGFSGCLSGSCPYRITTRRNARYGGYYEVAAWVRLPALTFLSLVEGNPGGPGDGILVSTTGGISPILFELQPVRPVTGTGGLIVWAFLPTGVLPSEVSLQVNFGFANYPVTQCSIGGGSSFPELALRIRGAPVRAYPFPEDELRRLVDVVRTSPFGCAGITREQLVIHSLIIHRILQPGTFLLQLDALAVSEASTPP